MITRCTKCNNAFDFQNVAGNRLADFKCECGGYYQRVQRRCGKDYFENRDGVKYFLSKDQKKLIELISETKYIP